MHSLFKGCEGPVKVSAATTKHNYTNSKGASKKLETLLLQVSSHAKLYGGALFQTVAARRPLRTPAPTARRHSPSAGRSASWPLGAAVDQ